MHRSTMRLLLPVALLAACPPVAEDSVTTSAPEGSSGSSGPSDVSGSTTSGSMPTSTGASESTTDPGTTGEPATTEDASTAADTGTTQPVATSGDDTTGPDTTGFATTGTTGDDETSTGHSDDIPETTGGELCEPGRDGVDVEWSLEVPPGLVGVDIQATCMVVGAVEMEPEVAVTLSCDIAGEPQQIVLHYSLLPFDELEWPLWDLELDYRVEQGAWTREWLSVSGVPGIRAVRADRLAPPGTTVEEFYGQEIVLDAPCDPQPDACGQRQGLQLGFYHWAEGMEYTLPIRSGEFMQFGWPLRNLVWLEHASRLLEPPDCADVAPRWFDMVLVLDGSGF